MDYHCATYLEWLNFLIAPNKNGMASLRSSLLTSGHVFVMPQLDDRIRDLCAKAVVTNDSAELRKILKDLRAAIHEHTRRLRKLAASYPMDPEKVSHS